MRPLPRREPGAAGNLRRLREHIKRRNPHAGFGSEILSDLVARKVDFLHA